MDEVLTDDLVVALGVIDNDRVHSALSVELHKQGGTPLDLTS